MKKRKSTSGNQDETSLPLYTFRAPKELVDLAREHAARQDPRGNQDADHHRGNLSRLIRRLLATVVGRPDLSEVYRTSETARRTGSLGGLAAAKSLGPAGTADRARKAVAAREKKRREKKS